MAAGDDRVRGWLATHAGVISTQQFYEFGFSYAQVRHRIERGDLAPLCRGVYRATDHPESDVQRMVGACLAIPESAIGFTTAGRLYGFRGMTDPRVHVVVPHHVRVTFPGIELHRTRRLDPVDLGARRPDGIRLTSPPRTLFEAASIIGRDATESAVEQALAEGRLTLPTLMSTALRLHHVHVAGAVTFLDVMESRPRWQRAARSELERRVRQAIKTAGLPEPVVNLVYRLANGGKVEIDLAFPPWKVAVEVDHPYWHGGRLASMRDARRDRKLSREGWVTVRFPEHDIRTALPELIDDLAALLVIRGWSPTSAPHGEPN